MRLLLAIFLATGLVSPQAWGESHAPHTDILAAISVCGSSLSPARKLVVAQQISRIGGVYLHGEELDAYVGLLCIESKFDPAARSSRGAVGIAQLMPRYAMEFAEECGLPNLTEADVGDTETNLTISACHFANLLRIFDGNVALALSGYNSGQDSKTTKQLARLVDTGAQTETTGYIAKFYVFLNKMEKEKKHAK